MGVDSWRHCHCNWISARANQSGSFRVSESTPVHCSAHARTAKTLRWPVVASTACCCAPAIWLVCTFYCSTALRYSRTNCRTPTCMRFCREHRGTTLRWTLRARHDDRRRQRVWMACLLLSNGTVPLGCTASKVYEDDLQKSMKMTFRRARYLRTAGR
jgi:hypothetical protein